MKVMIDFCIVPLGIGVSVSPYVTATQKVFEEAGLNYVLHGFGTNVEGEWDEVFAAVKRCHEVIHEMGVPRIHATVRLGTRIDKEQTIQDKLDSVAAKL